MYEGETNVHIENTYTINFPSKEIINMRKRVLSLALLCCFAPPIWAYPCSRD